MSATFKNLLLLITAVLALAGGYWIAQSMRPVEQVTTLTYGGGELIDFTLPDLEGKKRSLHEWRRTELLLAFLLLPVSPPPPSRGREKKRAPPRGGGAGFLFFLGGPGAPPAPGGRTAHCLPGAIRG